MLLYLGGSICTLVRGVSNSDNSKSYTCVLLKFMDPFLDGEDDETNAFIALNLINSLLSGDINTSIQCQK